MAWLPWLQLPIEWAALALLVLACLYWERSGFSGLGVEGCLASATLGLLLGYEATGSYALACAAALGFSIAFALLTSVLIHLLRSDPAIGAFASSLVPGCVLGLWARAEPLRLWTETPPPGLVRGTVLDGTYAEDLLANPWLWAAPLLIAIGAWVLRSTPFGLRLRAFGENPSWRVPGSRPLAYRLAGPVVGAIAAVAAAALLARAHPGAPPLALGYLALACTVAARWSALLGVLLAAGPALLRTARPLAAGVPEWSIALELAPFLLALLYLVLLSRRALRLSYSPQAGTDPDVL